VVGGFGQVIRYDDQPRSACQDPVLDAVRLYSAQILTLDAEPQLSRPSRRSTWSWIRCEVAHKRRLKFPRGRGRRRGKAREALSAGHQQRLRGESANHREGSDRRDRRKIMELLSVERDKDASGTALKWGRAIQRVSPTEVRDAVYRNMRRNARASPRNCAPRVRGGREDPASAERQRDICWPSYRDAEATPARATRVPRRSPEGFTSTRSSTHCIAA